MRQEGPAGREKALAEMSETTRTKLRKAGVRLRIVERLYKADLDTQRLSADLMYEVCALLRDLKDVLDSLAWDVDRFSSAREDGSSPSFPIAIEARGFKEQMRQFGAAIRVEHPAIWASIERQQPWHDNKWELRHLRNLASVDGHRQFSPQTRLEETWSTIIAPNGGRVSFTEMGAAGIGVRGTGHGMVYFVGQSVDRRTLQPSRSARAGAEHTIYVDWLFADLGISVLGTLRALHRIVTEAEADIAATLPA